MAGAVVDVGGVFLAGGFHFLFGGFGGGGDAVVVAAVEGGDGGVDVFEFAVVGRGAVEDGGGVEGGLGDGVVEGHAAAPAETDGDGFAVGGGLLEGVVAGGVEIGDDDVGFHAADGAGDIGAGGEGFGAAAVGAFAGEEVGCDGDEAVGGELVGDGAGPVGEAEDFVDDEDDGGLVFSFGVDDVGFEGGFGAGDVDVDEFAVARGGIAAGLGVGFGGGVGRRVGWCRRRGRRRPRGRRRQWQQRGKNACVCSFCWSASVGAPRRFVYIGYGLRAIAGEMPALRERPAGRGGRRLKAELQTYSGLPLEKS